MKTDVHIMCTRVSDFWNLWWEDGWKALFHKLVLNNYKDKSSIFLSSSEPGVPPTAGSTGFSEAGRVAVKSPQTGLAVLLVTQAWAVWPASFRAGHGSCGAYKDDTNTNSHFNSSKQRTMQKSIKRLLIDDKNKAVTGFGNTIYGDNVLHIVSRI